MRIREYILMILALTLLLFTHEVRADSERSQENKIKAAFLFNFMKFVEWPADKMGDVNEPFVVGIIGSKDFIEAFKPITQRKFHDRSIVLKYFGDYEEFKKAQEADMGQWNRKIEALKRCHLLMFCSCDSGPLDATSEIINALRNFPVLTVGEKDGFLESGGVINFLMEGNKVCFEVNSTAAKANKLKISSNLLRLAKRVIEKK